MLNMKTRLVGFIDSHIIWYNNTLDRGLINDSKGNVKIVFEWRCGADWPGQRRGAKTRKGTACQRPANKKNGRCRLHGGASTGPKTDAGRAMIAKSNTKHGNYT
jgi:hypothetical protein